MAIVLHLRRSLVLAAIATAAACSAHGISGSLTLDHARPYVMRMRSEHATDLHVQIRNHGPADVAVSQLGPDAGGNVSGTLVADGPKLEWRATTTHFELLLTPADAPAIVAYTVSSSGSVEMYIGPPQ